MRISMLAALAAVCVLIAHESQAQIISNFTPSGTVKNVRQVRVQFSEAMVPFGDPRLKSPFKIQCDDSIKYTTRWADPRNWILDFEQDLPGGVKCRFDFDNSVKTLSGKTLKGQTSFAFNTGGPQIRLISPAWEGQKVAIDEVFVVLVDTPYDPKSLTDKVFFMEGDRKIPVRIISGKDRAAVIKNISEHRLRRSDGTRAPDSLLLVLQPAQKLPEGSMVQLIWSKGILSKSGVLAADQQSFSFRTEDPFIASFSCTRDNDDADCNPMTEMQLDFTTYVPNSYLAQIRLEAKGKVWRPAEYKELRKDLTSSRMSVNFQPPFPEKTKFKLVLPAGIKDELGRALANGNKFPLSVATDAYAPLAKFSGRFGVVEAKDPLLPVTLRNLEKDVPTRELVFRSEKLRPGDYKEIIRWLRLVTEYERDWSKREVSLLKDVSTARTFKVSKSTPRAFEVIGLPLKDRGLHVVEIESPKLGRALLEEDTPMYVQTAALVTNMSVHVKKGRERSLVWVTTLDPAAPVKDAAVTVVDCEGKTTALGKTNADGVLMFNTWPPEPSGRTCDSENPYNNGFFVFAEKDGDVTFLHSSWDKGIESWRYNLNEWGNEAHPNMAHAVLDRKLLRAGERVSMKFYLRRHYLMGIEKMGAAETPKSVRLIHNGSSEMVELPLKVDAKSGIGELVYEIPKTAKLGHYSIYLSLKPPKPAKSSVDLSDDVEGEETYYDSGTLNVGSFQVEEFRVPALKAQIREPKDEVVAATSVPFTIGVEYLNGGAAQGMNVRVRSEIDELIGLSFPNAREDFSEFRFTAGPVKVGRQKHNRSYDEAPTNTDEARVPKSTMVTLDKSGGASYVVKSVPLKNVPQTVRLEVEYQDPSGEMLTAAKSVTVYPSAALVGLRSDGWFNRKDNMKFEAVVVSPKGEPLAGRPVEIKLYRSEHFGHRRRVVGGFYSYESYNEIKPAGTACKGVTDARGRFSCHTKLKQGGDLIAEAITKDAAGRANHSQVSVYVSDGDNWWGELSDSDRIDLLPEKKRYEPGETAKFLVKTPFQEALALVTLEREGVLSSFLTKVTREKSYIEVPVQGHFAPNIYVSAMLVRGRVGESKPTAIVDLGRPAFKMGIAEIQVGYREHELLVDVKPSKEVVRVREKVKVKIKAVSAAGKKLASPAEVAVAVVDEGLLQLRDNESWNLLGAMMGQRPYELRTFTSQSQVIGKRHYGLKAQPSGGDGGTLSARELFDTLLFWKGRVPLNSRGEAEVEFKVNDSLTSVRIVAIASSGWDMFGTGSAKIRTTQDLMLFAGLPPVVREGDSLTNEVTVRNASEKAMNGTLEARADAIKVLKTQNFKLKPGEAMAFSVPFAVPVGIGEIQWTFTAKSGDYTDKLNFTQKVYEAVKTRVYQATLSQVDKNFQMKVEKPADALEGKGGVKLITQPKLGRGLATVKFHMSRYPYSCLEQNVSKAVVLEDAELWRSIEQNLSQYFDGDDLLKYFPQTLYGYDSLSAYVLEMSRVANFELSDTNRERIINGLTKFISGGVSRSFAFSTVDLSIRQVAAAAAVCPFRPLKWNDISAIEVQPNLWPVSGLVDYVNLLRCVDDVPDREKLIAQVDTILRARLNFQGTTMGFSHEGYEKFWWLMRSVDFAAAKFLYYTAPQEKWREDVLRLVRGLIGRQRHGQWDLTTANAWGAVALRRFSELFEKQPVTGKLNAELVETKTVNWSKTPEGTVMDMKWPKAGADLKVTQEGGGKPWLTVQALAAIPLQKPITSGYSIRRTVTAVEAQRPGVYTKNDVLRVRLEINAQADMGWVVVEDPVPPGSMILGRGLGGDSSLLTAGQKRESSNWWAGRPSFEERKFDVYRAYYDYMPKGKYVLEYTVRLNNAGEFKLPPTRVEALYSPEMLGEYPNPALKVLP